MTIQAETMEKTGENAGSAAARRAMIDSQLRTSGVNEEFVLARMIAVPREDFLPEDKAPLAYIDRSVTFGDGAHLASPLFYGKLLVEAEPAAEDRVLVIDGGSGYLTELVRPLVAEVDTVSVADAAEGSALKGKMYSLVLIDGAIEHLPDNLADTVEDGGRLVSGFLLRQVTRLAAGRKIAGTVTLQPVEDLGIPVIHAFDKPKGWSF